MESLGSEVQKSYTWVDPSRFKDIARILEGRFEHKWFERYREILRDSRARISISCEAGPSRKGRFRLRCSADILEPVAENRGSASGVFSRSWVAGPVDPGSAITYLAERIVRHMQVESVPGEVSVVDWETRSKTKLTNHVAGRLLDKINAIRDLSPRVVDGEVGTSSYRVEGTLARHPDRLVLRVELYSGAEDAFRTSFRESTNWTPALRELAGSAGWQVVSGCECEAGVDPGER